MVDFFFIRFQSTLPRGERRYGLDGYTVANVFQSTLPRGERHPALRSPPRISSFQSTLPRGERQLAELLDCVSKGNFNPRSHEGSDDFLRCCLCRQGIFQSTLPRGERHCLILHGGYDCLFQSTLPRGERHKMATLLVPYRISIHAPTRGATLAILSLDNGSQISIHAPTRGATLHTSEAPAHKAISIHAPTRGATKINLGETHAGNTFQSTLPRGERHFIALVSRLLYDFNPRSHEGSDGNEPVYLYVAQNFNPRSHEGSDSNFRQKVLFSLSKNCLKYLILTTNYFN